MNLKGELKFPTVSSQFLIPILKLDAGVSPRWQSGSLWIHFSCVWSLSLNNLTYCDKICWVPIEKGDCRTHRWWRKWKLKRSLQTHFSSWRTQIKKKPKKTNCIYYVKTVNLCQDEIMTTAPFSCCSKWWTNIQHKDATINFFWVYVSVEKTNSLL